MIFVLKSARGNRNLSKYHLFSGVKSRHGAMLLCTRAVVFDMKESISDIILAQNRRGGWDRTQRRAYQRVLSGCKFALQKYGAYYHLTLTSAPVHDRLAHAWDLLVKRVRRELNFGFHYCKVETKEGNGVYHVLFYGLGWKNWRYDEMHAYFSALWLELNNSPVVWLSTYVNRPSACGYIISQYLAKSQHSAYVRLSHSISWCFRGFVAVFKRLLKTYGFRNGIRLFDFAVSQKKLPFGEFEEPFCLYSCMILL